MMKSPEEEADKELAKRLQQRFEGFKAPVHEEVRENIFVVLGESSRTAYWIPRAGGLLLLVLQTFQLVNLIPSASDHIQNFRFAPLLSSRSLSYKVTAGVEKKNTRLSFNYAYLRSWNEYEVGTNQVVATKIGGHEYSMSRVGEKYVKDDRSHLLGIGIQQQFLMPQHILKGYSVLVGAQYTRVMPNGQDLVWGNLGFYKSIYQSTGIRLEVGPYAQYSFMQREIAGQAWKSRPYQVGVSFHIKME